MARLAVDIGGTFTDLALEHRGTRSTAKVLTTPDAPERGVLQGMERILAQAGASPADLTLVIHATTLATNAIIERKGARTALVTTAGFRDVLQLGNESRYDQYDLNIDLPEPLVPRYLRLPVPERLDRSGRVLLPLDEAAVAALAPELDAAGVESVAIGFLHSFVQPAHEERARDVLARLLPSMPISISSEVSPEMREWERFSTTAANAYVQPLMARYLARLVDGLRASGAPCPLLLMTSGGGLTTVETASRFPIRLVESGPAAGAIFAAGVARRAGLDRVIAFDMGGTTAKLCLIDDGAPQTSRQFEVARVGRFRKGSGLPLRIPVIEMVEIGAGGGSIASVDALGRITVGPASAGAAPGPACFARGGTAPTVTDANLILGRYDAATFAGGTLPLRPDLARSAMARQVAEPLGLDTDWAALGVVEMVDENMASAARQHAVESGAQLDDRTMIAFGGGGPVHATRVAERVGVTRVVVPRNAGVGSAVGLLEAPVAFEVVRSLYVRLGAFDPTSINRLLAAMEAEARSVVERPAGMRPLQQRRMAFMRYVGQGHEIAVALPEGLLGEDSASRIRSAYDAAYAAIYERPVPHSEIEILSFSLSLSTAGLDMRVAVTEARTLDDARSRSIVSVETGVREVWAVTQRAGLSIASPSTLGPAVVVEDETSTLVPAGWRVRLDEAGSLILERDSADA